MRLLKRKKSLMRLLPSGRTAGGVLAVLLIALFTIIASPSAMAQEAPPPAPAAPQEGCTTDESYDVQKEKDGYGIITSVVTEIRGLVDTTNETLFNAVIGNSAFQSAVQAALVLSIVIYGLMIVMGLLPLTLADGVVRLIKFAIIVALTSEGGWGFFSEYVVKFFNDGTDELIREMTRITSEQGGFSVDQNNPLGPLDGAMNHVFAVQMFITVMALFFTGPYGALFGIILVYGVFTFLRSVFQAVWVYLLSFIAKALLFGLAPIFITFLLFQRTRHLFDGWLNQLINFSLQPILLFAFLGFYATLITQALQNIMAIDLCWSKFQQVGPFTFYFWRFMVNGQPYEGSWTNRGAEIIGPDGAIDPSTPIFPVEITDVLIFLLLAELAWRYTQVAMTIARELSSSSSQLAGAGGPLQNWFQNQKTRISNAGGAALKGSDIGGGQTGVGGPVGFIQEFRKPVSRG